LSEHLDSLSDTARRDAIQKSTQTRQLLHWRCHLLNRAMRSVSSICVGLLLATIPLKAATAPRLRKAQDIVIYEDAKFYASFPSIVKRADGELLVAFRRAPERRAFGEPSTSHTDPNSQLVLVSSRDAGRSWSREPRLIHAHAFGGSQDPCMVQLRDGTLVCTSYAWALVKPSAIAKLKQPVARAGDFVFLGGYLMRSTNGAASWQGPLVPPPCSGEPNHDLFGNAVPAYNRGAMFEGRNGKLYWVVASATTNAPQHTGVHLLISDDRGDTWKYSAPVAHDEKIEFNETSIYETPRGTLVAFIRSEKFNDHTVIARSTNGGKSFERWEDAGFQGHPHYALRLPDNRVLLIYGYRHAPFGIRARVLDAECTNAPTAEEIVLRDDGGNGDLGYPWATMATSNRVLVVYYFNRANATRHIAGTYLDLE
jgi:sialidase-1